LGFKRRESETKTNKKQYNNREKKEKRMRNSCYMKTDPKQAKREESNRERLKSREEAECGVECSAEIAEVGGGGRGRTVTETFIPLKHWPFPQMK